MTAKEFRLGNLISVLGNVVEVIKIYGDRKIEVHSDILQFWDVDIEENDEDVLPIPLTEEWLVKFGFTSPFIPSMFSSPNDDFYHIVKHDEKFIFRGLGASVVEVKTVHHLQNLYYFLTGEELEVKS